MREKSSKGMSRRQFLGLTGGVIGAAALASAGIRFNLVRNEREIAPDKIELKDQETDILVIGGGMAGLFAAVKGHDAGAKVTMVVKGSLGTSGQTPFAKGIFTYDPLTAEMGLEEYLEKISASALNTNNRTFTRQMTVNSQARVDELKEWGFFDSPLCHKAFSKPVAERNISVVERVMITHLIKEEGRIAGAAGFSIDDETIHIFNAKSVVLCTGAGGFKPNGFPICDLTHDGSAMAYRIGAKITGKEWNDGHGGSMDHPAACYDNWGDMFERTPGTNGMEIHHDLGVDANYTAYVKGNPVSMGPGMEPAEGGPYIPEGFGMNNDKGPRPTDSDSGPGGGPGGPPPGGKGPKGGGPGMSSSASGGASAGMAIHKSEGIVPINEKCESHVPGLYAAGDALGSYMAGAIYTQIGSSLAGSAVQGAIASEAAAEYCSGVTLPEIPPVKIKQIREEILSPLNRDAGYSPAWVTQTLQGIMIPNFILYIKKEGLLKAALSYVEELRDHHTPMLKASNLHELRLAHETANMIVNAEMKLKASLMRTESRCSHYRLDYPEMDEKNWEAWINIFQGTDGKMVLEKQPFGTWPV
ncbi:MAG: FAD-binding protein [Spirochaetales bacterium]|nr:FAD-binding protein [Spirochaetales bacterium]